MELGLDTRRAAKSDDLTDTVDYAGLADRVVALVEGEPVNLIETLAERIAAMCLEQRRRSSRCRSPCTNPKRRSPSRSRTYP